MGAAHVNEVLRGWRTELQPKFQQGREATAAVPQVPDPSGAS
jgi:hypothetical protein